MPEPILFGSGTYSGSLDHSTAHFSAVITITIILFSGGQISFRFADGTAPGSH